MPREQFVEIPGVHDEVDRGLCDRAQREQAVADAAAGPGSSEAVEPPREAGEQVGPRREHRLHDVDEPGPIDHHQGRCTALPVTKTAAELGLAGGDVPGLRPTQDNARERFEALPEHMQREILGRDRFEAWKAGTYPMSAWPRRIQHYEVVDGQRVQAWRDSIHTSPAPASKK